VKAWHWIAAALLLPGGALAAPVTLLPLYSGDIGVLLTVQGTVDGRPLRWLIDSGSTHNLLGATTSAPATQPAAGATLNSAAGRLRGVQVLLPDLRIGAGRFGDQTALQLDLAPLLGPLATQVDGVLGLPFLQGRRLQVDLQQRLIDVDAAAPPDAGALPLERVQSLPVIRVDIDGTPTRLLFDTGSAGGIVRLQRRGTAMAVALATRVDIAGTTRRQVPVADLPGTALSRALPSAVAGTLGMAALDGCRFTLDLQADRLWLHGCAGDSLRGGFGLQWTAQQGRLRLAYVLPGSPAERAGFEAGDEVLKLDGKAVSELDADRVLHDAAQLTIEVRRGGRSVAATLNRAYFLPPLPAR